MRVIPVIDLMYRQVVRGIGGRRGEYRSIQSQIAADARPATVAGAFVERFGFSQAYVADLDAIMGGSLWVQEWREIASAGLRPWLDAGIGTVAHAQRLFYAIEELQIDVEVVIGLESLVSPAELAAIQQLRRGSGIVSLDLNNAMPVTPIERWKSLSAIQIAQEAISLGTHRLIVLDLADVGEAGGTSTLQLCRELREKFPQIQLIAGGGVRGIDDLRALAEAGCDAALVASALHDGRLTKEDLEQLAVLL